MRYLSLFSGIEAFSVAVAPLGWTCVGVAEIEQFPCKVLAHHYPKVPNLGSVTDITEEQIKALGHIDLVVGGFPCQDLSVAGKRKGLRNEDGSATRSGLFFTAMRIVEWASPRWVIVENVPGLFSSQKGGDFASVVGEMAGCEFDIPKDGWKNSGVAVGNNGLVEWVTLDAQFCRTPQYPRAVPQRRRRVFVIRDSGDWHSRPPLFALAESMSGNPPPSRKARQEVAGTIGARTGLSIGAQDAMNGHMLPTLIGGIDYENNAHGPNDATGPLLKGSPTGGGRPLPAIVTCMARGQGGAEITEDYAPILNCNHEQPITFALAGNAIGRKPENGGNGIGFDDTGSSYTLTKTDVHAVAFAQNTRDEVILIGGDGQVVGALAVQPGMKQTTYIMQDVAQPLRSNGFNNSDPMMEAKMHIQQGMQVRRLTPLECERLQGFKDGYTNIPGASDTARYKALGNSMAVNVMQVIGQRIQMVSQIPDMEIAA